MESASSQSPDIPDASLDPLPQQSEDFPPPAAQQVIEPLPQAPKPPASRVSRIASIVLKISAVLIVILVVVFFGLIAAKRLFWVANWCAVSILILTCISLVAAVIRITSSVLSESNMRLNELLITVFFGATVTTLILAFFQPAKQNYDTRISTAGAVSVITFLLTGIGSAWGWSISSRMKISDSRERVKMLAFGWMLTVGSIITVALFVAILGILVNNKPAGNLAGGLLALIIIGGIGYAFTRPAMKLESKWRSEMKLK